MRALTTAAVVLASFALSACAVFQPDRIHYVWTPTPESAAAAASPPPTAAVVDPGPDALVGVALSGGGSRAATFSAAALEALHEHGLLAQTTHVSSVSGGGFAAVWHALNRPDLCEGATGDPACAEAAFAPFHAAMRRNYALDVTLRQLAKPNRVPSPTRRLSSLADALDEAFVHGATFADLPESPVLLLNAARLDDGRRFVFSNAVLPDDAGGIELLADPRLRAASFALPDCPRATPDELPLALAAAASAAFPIVLGPATLAAPADCAASRMVYWHLSDGGLIENLGLETLEEAALRALHGPGPPARVLIVSIDAETRPDADASFANADLSVWTSDPDRIFDVAVARGRGYHDLVWARLRAEASVPFEVLSIRYTDAELAEWPAACRREARASPGRDAIAARLAAIPTSLGISRCDADLLRAAAHQLVHAELNAAADALAASGFALETVTPHDVGSAAPAPSRARMKRGPRRR